LLLLTNQEAITLMQAMLDGPRHTLAESAARLQQKHDCPHLSHLTDDALADRTEATLATLPPEKVAGGLRMGLI